MVSKIFVIMFLSASSVVLAKSHSHKSHHHKLDEGTYDHRGEHEDRNGTHSDTDHIRWRVLEETPKNEGAKSRSEQGESNNLDR